MVCYHARCTVRFPWRIVTPRHILKTGLNKQHMYERDGARQEQLNTSGILFVLITLFVVCQVLITGRTDTHRIDL